MLQIVGGKPEEERHASFDSHPRVAHLLEPPHLGHGRRDDCFLRERISPDRAREILDSGIAQGGMRPKLEAAIGAIASGVQRVHLVDGRVPHALLLEIFTLRGMGTLIFEEETG